MKMSSMIARSRRFNQKLRSHPHEDRHGRSRRRLWVDQLEQRLLLARVELIQNGGFETGDFSGWGTFVESGSSGDIQVLTGTVSPISGFPVPPPGQSAHAVLTDQTGPGSYALFQDVSIPAGVTTVFSFDLFVGNRSGDFVIPSPDSLSFQGSANQQARVDVMNAAAPVQDVGAGVLQNLFRTNPGDPTVFLDANGDEAYRSFSFDLSAFAGQTIRLRFAEVDNQSFFQMGVDNVRLLTEDTLDRSVGLTANEPAVAISPADANLVAVTAGGTQRAMLRLSNDGAASFPTLVDSLSLIPASYQALAGFRGAGNADVSFDAAGDLYWSFVACTTATACDVFVARRDAVTGMFGTAVLVTDSANDPDFAQDDRGPMLGVDADPTSAFSGNVYVSWTKSGANAEVFFAGSTDGGATWSAPVQLSNSATEGRVALPHVDVAPGGDVYVAYHSQPGLNGVGEAGGNPDGISGQTFVARSIDGGASFAQKTLAFLPGQSDVSFNVQSSPGGIAGTQFSTFGAARPYVLADPVRPGFLYVITNDDPDNAHGLGDDANVVLARSTDNGNTWTRTTISTGPSGNIELMPRAAIDQSGNIVVVWYDARFDARNVELRSRFDVFATLSDDSGLSFLGEFRISDVPFDPDPGAATRLAGPPPTTEIGDYNGLAAARGRALAVWTGNEGQPPTTQQILLNSFAIGGPRVLSANPSGSVAPPPPPQTFVDFTFNTAIDPASFGVSDVIFTGPSGPIVPTSVTPLSSTTFRVSFPPQATTGTYNMTIGPDIRDLGGTPMDQDRDTISGEAIEDRFTNTFVIDAFGPRVIAVIPAVGSSVAGPVGSVTFVFDEAIDPTTFTTADVVAITGPSGAISALGVIQLSANTFRVDFPPQGSSGAYSVTIGPEITDQFGNRMDQNQNGAKGEVPGDRFTATFSISTPRVTGVVIAPTTITVAFNKDLLPSTLVGNVFVERSGSDGDFTNGNEVIVATFASATYSAATDTLVITMPGGLPSDLYRVRLESGGIEDLLGNDLDGEFPGINPPSGPNGFPSGDNVVGGDFLFTFAFGSGPTQTPSADVLPPAQVTGSPVNISNIGGTESNPSVAIDPVNPNRMVAVYNRNLSQFAPLPNPSIFVEAAFSTDGGQTWTRFSLPSHQLDPNTTNPVLPYAQSTNASVAFDRNGGVYIVYTQHNAAFTSGAIVLQKYNFSGGSPVATTFRNLYRWVQDPAFNPTVVVDNTLPTFTDPDTGRTIVNPFSGNVYVAWNTNNVSPPNLVAATFNPNVIKVLASSDGGETFSTQVPVNTSPSVCVDTGTFPSGVLGSFQSAIRHSVNCGAERHASPRLAVSQGTTDGRVSPGQLTVIWDDFGTGFNTDVNAAFDRIRSDRITNGGSGELFQGSGGPIADAAPGTPNVVAVTDFIIPVNITDPRFVALTDLDVTLNIDHANLSELQILLVSPGGTAVTLLRNRTDEFGVTPNPVTHGAAGNMMGTTASGIRLGTVFDQDAPRSIFHGATPYTGRFRPEGNLDAFNGLTVGQINGNWTLRITDFRDGNLGTLINSSLNFTSGLTSGVDSTVATTNVVGAFNGPYRRTVPASPNRGISPSPSIASDNTLGDFSPFQGRLYVAFVDRRPASTDNPDSNTDIYVAFSDNGGLSWTPQGLQVRVNDDGAFDGTTGQRTQFNPAIAVDQVTGTPVVAWLDARDDAANARVATYLAASIDGGQTWSENVFANTPHSAVDNYDNTVRTYGPIPDNQSNANASRDQNFNYGDRMALVAVDGRALPVWPSNQNRTETAQGPQPPAGTLSDIVIGQMRFTNGPRIVDSTMGWLTTAGFFDFTFDRIVDPGTIGPDDVAVIFRNVSGVDTSVPVTAIVPLACTSIGCTQFRVLFTPQPGAGTYRYAIGPGIRDRIRSEVASAAPVPPFTAISSDVPKAIPPVGSGGSGIPGNDTTLSTLLVTSASPSDVITDVDVTVNLTYPGVGDLVLSLIHPDGTSILLANHRGGTGDNYTNTTFSDQAALSIAAGMAPFVGTFRPESPLSALNGKNVNGVWRLSVLDSSAASVGTLTSWSIRISSATAATGFQLGNFMDQNANGIAAEAGPATSPDAFLVPRSFSDTGTLPLMVSGPRVLTTRVGVEYTADDTAPLPIADGGTVESVLLIRDQMPITDLDVVVDVSGANLADLRVELIREDNLKTIFFDPTTVLLFGPGAASGTTMSRTVFSDEAALALASGAAPYRATFRPAQPLSALDDSGAPFSQSDINGAWRLRITDTNPNGSGGTLNGWALIVNPNPSADRLSLHGTANFMDVVFDRDVDPATFTTVDIERLIGPAGAIGANPLGPFRFQTTDTVPVPVPIPDGARLNSTITVPRDFLIADLDVLIDISHPAANQLRVFLIAPDGTRVELLNGLPSGANLLNTILDDEATRSITTGTAPFVGRFRPTQSLGLFDNLSPEGTWTLEINDLASGSTGTLNRWELVLTASPRLFAATPALSIPDDGTSTATVTSTIIVPDSFPIHDLNVTLSIKHPRVQDLDVVLVGPDGVTRIPLVAGLPATGADLNGTTFDDQAANNITTAAAPYFGTFRPIVPATGRVTLLGDLNGLDARGTWTLEVRDTTANNTAGALQTLNNWTLAITASEFEVLANPNGTDPDAAFPRTYRVYFSVQSLSGTYLLNVSPNIVSQDGEELDNNRNAGLAALRRGGTPNTPETTVDFRSTFASSDVGDPVNGKPVPEPFVDPISGVQAPRPLTSQIFIPDNVTIADINVRLTLTSQVPVTSPPSNPLFRADDFDVFLISPNGTRIHLFTDVGGPSVNFVQTVLDDEALRFGVPIHIEDGTGPFSESFRPERFRDNGSANPGLSSLDGEQARGVWTLEIVDDTANDLTGTLRGWELVVSGRTTGLGEFGADQIATSFRIFVQDPSDVRSSTQWTAVGPQGVAGRNSDSSRSGAIAVDPSDPSGNTVYLGGATSGVWKTTNFLTTDSGGPTWVPLTDFAATFGLNMGSIALFPRNNDPNQTIVYVATGEADAGFVGVGFLKSEDGGATWTLQDSLNNDPSIPFAQRDHFFSRQTTVFKIVVDPTFPDGRVAYAAMSGPRGGLYKTVNGGINWVNTRPGQATDVVLDPVNTEIVYSAFRGQGVFISPNRGASWNAMTGGINNVQVRDADLPPSFTVPINPPAGTPNGAKGRISLAKPFLTGNATLDRAYEGRLYALVATPNDLLDGVYMTSDFGANWTRLNLPAVPPPPNIPASIPTNNENTGVQVDPFTTLGGRQGQGNYDQIIIVDPLNPNRVYVCGAADVPCISIDVALTYDGHNITTFDHDNADGGLTRDQTAGSVVREDPTGPAPPVCAPSLGLVVGFAVLCDPQPEVGVFANTYTNIASINNTGHETRWSPLFPPAHVDYHDVAVIVDPVTGRTRLLLGTDGGIYTTLVRSGYDATGKPEFTLSSESAVIGNSRGAAVGSRNGNLQMTQIYGGATHPSQIAADIAGALFYGATQDNGANRSNPRILENGNLAWGNGFGSGDAGDGMATVFADDDSLLGSAYVYAWPCCQANPANVFQASQQGGPFLPRVAGLDAENWDVVAPLGPFDFGINFRDGRQLIMSGPSGTLYKTDDGGMQWLVVGQSAIFGGQIASAYAYGAEQPDPDPLDLVEPDETMVVGFPGGQIFGTLTEGGDSGAEWFNISAGLDGAPVTDIAANIRQFSREVFAVTSTGVFHLRDVAAAINEVIVNGPGQNVVNRWENITGNLRSIRNTLFPDAWNGEGTLGPIVDTIPLTFSSIKIDDRYAIPDPTFVPDPSLPPDDPANQPPRFPVLYVAAGGDVRGLGQGGGAGVYRSFDLGRTWRQFPDIDIDGAPVQGGYLPNADIRELELAVGPYDPETGLSDFNTSLDLLVVHTFGRGTFAIRSAPIVLSTVGSVLDNAPDLLNDDDTGVSNGDNITSHDGSAAAPLRVQGLTYRGATVRLLLDESGVLTEVGRGVADAITGEWTVAVGDADGNGTPDGFTLECGPHRIRAQAVSAAGTVGPVSDDLLISVLNEPPVSTAPDLIAADDHGTSDTDDLTNVTTPRFSGRTTCQGSGEPVPAATITLFAEDVSAPGSPIAVGTAISDVSGNWIVQVASPLAEGTYEFFVRADDLAGNVGADSDRLVVTIDITVSPTPSITGIRDDTGRSATDRITRDQTLFLDGIAEPFSDVEITHIGVGVVGTTRASATGTWTFDYTATALPEGMTSFTAAATDPAGNTSAPTLTFVVVVDLTPPAAPVLTGITTDSGQSASDGITNDQTLLISGTAEPNSEVTLTEVLSLGPIGTAIANGTGNWTFDLTGTTLAEGDYRFTATATDRAGNTGPASLPLNVTVDITPPPTPPGQPDLLDDSFGIPSPTACSVGNSVDNITRIRRPRLTGGGAEPNSVVTIFDGTTPIGTTLADAAGNWNFTPTADLSDGAHNITVRNTDLAGNVGPSSLVREITIDSQIQTPARPSLAPGNDTGRSGIDGITRLPRPTLQGTAERNGCVKIFDGALVLAEVLVDSSGNWNFTPAADLANGNHSITVRATDPAGNTSAQASQALSITIDTIAPNAPTTPDLTTATDSPPSNVDNITNADPTTFVGTAEANAIVRLFSDVTGQVGQVTTTGSWSINATLAEGIHNITATAEDVAGNVSAPSGAATVRIDRSLPTVDVTFPPDASVFNAATWNNGCLTPGGDICGTAADVGVAGLDRVEVSVRRISTGLYWTGVAFASPTEVFLPATGTTNWSLAFPSTNFPADGNYAIRSRARDSAGNEQVSSTETIIFDSNPPSSTITFPVNGASYNNATWDAACSTPSGDACGTASDTASGGQQVQVSLRRTSTGLYWNGASFSSAVEVFLPAAGVSNWTFAFAASSFPADGQYAIHSRARDNAGNEEAGPTVTFTIDNVPPVINPTPPSLVDTAPRLIDDTGIQGDNLTTVRRPRLTGSTDANLTVDILDLAGNVLGTTTSMGDGSYIVQISSHLGTDLADGNHTVRARVRDAAGNSAQSASVTLGIDSAAPRVADFTPTGTQTALTSVLSATLDSGDLNVCPSPTGPVSLCGTNPAVAFASSVVNPANYSLRGSGGDGIFTNGNERVINLAGAQFQFVAAANRVQINLSAALSEDTWRFTMNGTSSAQDRAGNRVDGEFSGTFPSGNGIPGGDFVVTFGVDLPPLQIINVGTRSTRRVITHVDLMFNAALDRSLAENGSFYELRDAGKDRLFDTRDDKIIVLARPTCNPLPADCTAVTLRAIRGFSRKRPVRLTVRDGVEDLGGNKLDGNSDGLAGGNFVRIIGPLAAQTGSRVAAQVVDRMLESGQTATDLLVESLTNARGRRGRASH